MKQSRIRSTILALLSAPLLLSAASPVVYNFQGGTTDGANPKRTALIGSSGQLFITTVYGGSTNNGIVAELTPAAGNTWKETVLYKFMGGTDGAEPDGALIANGASMYGTTSIGGAPTGSGFGTVFQLKKSAGKWIESVLYHFTGGSDGANPYAGLVLNGSILYGTAFIGGLKSGASGYGTVFSLTPPTKGATWTQSVLHTFAGPLNDGANPHSPLLLAPNGVYYGTTYNGGNSKFCALGCGTVFQLSQSGGVWTETPIYNFGATSTDGHNPHGDVIMDPTTGVIYGTTLDGGTNGKGTVFSLTPSGTSWTYAVLHDFAGGSDGAEPRAGVTLGPTGVLYGATIEGGGSTKCTSGCGTLYSLTQSGSTWTENIMYSFQGGTGPGADGAQPYADMVLSNGKLYGSTYAGGTGTTCASMQGCGTVFVYTVP